MRNPGNSGALSAYGYKPKATSDPNKGDRIEIRDCLFLNNTCSALTSDCSNISIGGGIRIGGDTPEAMVLRCSFVGNTSENQGGGLAIAAQPDLVKIYDCTFSGNSTTGNAYIGGGMITETATEVWNCTFIGNEANQGSAIFVTNSGSCEIRNSIILNNPRVADGTYIRQVRPDLGFTGIDILPALSFAITRDS